MENSNNENELLRLYNSFVKAIDSADDLLEFSSDDLLDIFDYAINNSDEYIATESVMEGLRRTPHDIDFIKRKAFMFHEFGNEDACERVISQLPSSEFVRKALSLRDMADSPVVDDVFKKMFSIIESGSVEDWDIIYLIDLFEAVGNIDFIARNGDEITRVSQSPAVFYTELYNLYYEQGLFEEALEVGKRLCDLNAFDEESWCELANIHMMKFGDSESALECAEYALAINPDNITALSLKAIALLETNPKESHKIIDRNLRKFPGEPRLLFAQAYIDMAEDKEQQGIDHVVESCKGLNINQRRDTLLWALHCVTDLNGADDLIGLVTELLNEDATINSNALIEMFVRKKAYTGAMCVAIASIKAGKFEFSNLSNVVNVCEAFYYEQYIDDLIMFITNIGPQEDGWIYEMHPVLTLIYAVCLLKLRRYDELKSYVNRVAKEIVNDPESATMQELIFYRANVDMLLNLQKQLSERPISKLNESKFNPFVRK